MGGRGEESCPGAHPELFIASLRPTLAFRQLHVLWEQSSSLEWASPHSTYLSSKVHTHNIPSKQCTCRQGIERFLLRMMDNSALCRAPSAKFCWMNVFQTRRHKSVVTELIQTHQRLIRRTSGPISPFGLE